MLDALLGRAVRVDGWEQALDLALDRPDLVVVTADGDRFADVGLAGPLVHRRGDRRRGRRGRAAQAAAAERAADQAARPAGRGPPGRRGDPGRPWWRPPGRSTATSRPDGRARPRPSAPAERAGAVGAELEGTRRARARGRGRAVDADAGRAGRAASAAVPELEAGGGRARRRARPTADGAPAVPRGAAGPRLAALRQELEVRSAGLAERRGCWRPAGSRSSAGWRATPTSARPPPRAAAGSRPRAWPSSAWRALVEGERARLEGVLDGPAASTTASQVEAVRAGGERLEALRRDRADAERRLWPRSRERTRALDLEAAEVALRSETAGRDGPARARAASPARRIEAPAPELPEGDDAGRSTPPAWPSELASLGPVNPLALEELSVPRGAPPLPRGPGGRRPVGPARAPRGHPDPRRRDHAVLRRGRRRRERALLGPGGHALPRRDRAGFLTEPDDLLNTGVEVEVRPAGRNVRRLSLLSGGERSLAALAFLFAVFRSRPSPFYLMDEVEAALDDVNLHRFLGLVHEFRDEAQLIIVSHQKRTMETGDALYGVTMAPGGSSQVVSQKVAPQEPDERPPPADGSPPGPARGRARRP